ncbi:acyl-CoA dehydrogenase NM domain-like protein [Gymnopilus junonius]|uniref:Acyl-CoA dehydrogenase NM domain-like protein n=1 Tax=Gymnopilus junonius TaxID=109634 RepID=A0A9P5NS73_GYMJU|nr:acyl-CoA dehydrogenase NM domain-like protein [Gymnopilus junonius]
MTIPTPVHPTRALAQSPLFQNLPVALPKEEQTALSYARAKAVAPIYNMSVEDVAYMSEKFWLCHTDPIWTMDGAACTLYTIQINLCAGTLARYLKQQPYLKETLQKVLSFEYSGQFCLTEVGHGLNALHLETTATLENGEFVLNTPSDGAAKFMPPTKPMGDRCVAVVFASTIVEGENHGVKPFLVPINDGVNMHPGVICKVLPHRGGSHPVNHSLTYFNNVRLPMTALLGPLEKPQDPRTSFLSLISRVAVGTIAIGSLGVPALQVASYIAAKYSLRRTITDSKGLTIPIISLRTQQAPILIALAQAFVMKAFQAAAVKVFMNQSLDFRVRHAVATIMKVVVMQHSKAASLGLGDRCGAQGLFEINQLFSVFCDLRGSAIAEGDTLALSIRLASELLLRRYGVPTTNDPKSLLALHEEGLFRELQAILKDIGHHRASDFDRLVLPECLPLVQAIGHRMAYDAAISAGVDLCLIDLYAASCVRLDSSWYVENQGLSRIQQREVEAAVIDRVFPKTEEFLYKMGVEPYIIAPIISEERWEDYISSLPPYSPSSSA